MNSIKTYLPSIIIAGIIAASAPFMRPAQSQERQHRLIPEQRTQAQVVVITIQQKFSQEPYTLHGFEIYNSSSSTGAPTFGQYPNQNTDAAQGMADLYNSGFELAHATDYSFTFVKK